MGAIDAVVTWVDGSNPQHIKKRREALLMSGHHPDRPSNGTEETRFSNLGEIYYCIASILKYAPFVRYIYVVADNQVPSHIQDFVKCGLCEAGKIRIVDHRTIFEGYEEFLPTFNSLSIELMLWRIPGLSEAFLYFNDDVFLNAPVSPDDFMDASGRMVVYGRPRSVWPRLLKYRLKKIKCFLKGRVPPAHFKTAQMHAARLFNLADYVEVGHTPHLMRRSVFREFFERHPQAVRRQLKPKFRTLDQFLPAGLPVHAAFRESNVELRRRQEVYLKPSLVGPNQLDMIRNEHGLFGCAQSLDRFKPTDLRVFRTAMADKLAEYLPKAALLWMEQLDRKRMSRQRDHAEASVLLWKADME
mgnify:CR=1 FL=1